MVRGLGGGGATARGEGGGADRDTADVARGDGAGAELFPTGISVSQMGQVTWLAAAGGANVKLHSGQITDEEGIKSSSARRGALPFHLTGPPGKRNKKKAKRLVGVAITPVSRRAENACSPLPIRYTPGIPFFSLSSHRDTRS